MALKREPQSVVFETLPPPTNQIAEDGPKPDAVPTGPLVPDDVGHGTASPTVAIESAPVSVRIPQNDFSFTIPRGWSVFSDSVNTHGFGYMLSSDHRGASFIIQCPPVNTNFEGFARLAGSNLTYTQERTFVANDKKYVITYQEYAPVNVSVGGVLVHVHGGSNPEDECKIGSTYDKTGYESDSDFIAHHMEMVNGVKQIYSSWR